MEFTPPLDAFGKNISTTLQILILSAMDNRGDYWSQELEAEAKQTAPWTDRTGQARQGLTGRHEVDGGSGVLRIHLFHTKDYGPYLELGTGGRPPFASILPTMQRHYPEILADFKRIFE